MIKLDTQILHKMLGSPFSKVVSQLMNHKEESLVRMATYNLQMATGNPKMEEFVQSMLLPYIRDHVAPQLPVYSSGGRCQTAQVLNDLIVDFESELGMNLNNDDCSSAMKYSFLFLSAFSLIEDPSLAKELGIRKIGFFKSRWTTED